MADLGEVLSIVGDYLEVPRYKIVDGPDFDWEIFPAVAKIATMEHKSERGGVILGIKNMEELREAVNSLLHLSDKVMIQEEIKGLELFLGGKEDPSFGPTISFGLGGIFVEVYGDVATRLAPLNGADVLDMVEELRGGKVLRGHRGIKVNFEAVVRSVVSFSRFLERYRPRVAEVNPLIVNEKGAYAVDVRVIF